MGSVRSGSNPHNWVDKDKVRALFTRWVSKEVHDAQLADGDDSDSDSAAAAD